MGKERSLETPEVIADKILEDPKFKKYIISWIVQEKLRISNQEEIDRNEYIDELISYIESLKQKEEFQKLLQENEEIKEMLGNAKRIRKDSMKIIKKIISWLFRKDIEKNKNIEEIQKEIDNSKEKIQNLELKNSELAKKYKDREIENEALLVAKTALEDQKISLETEIKGFMVESEKKESNIEKLEKEKKELVKENHKYQKEKEGIQELYPVKEIYEKYLSISSSTRTKLEGLIKSTTILDFFISCCDLQAMDNLWDAVNSEIKRASIEDCKVLGEVFRFFIECVNKKYNEDMYIVVVPKVGETYDPIDHIEMNSNGKGQITDIVFPGYGRLGRRTEEDAGNNRKIEKIRKKPIVRT